MRNGEHGLLVTATEAATLFRVPIGTIRRWAHEDHWHPFGGPRSRHWRMDDIDASYTSRRSATPTCA